jgi:hypothetical protein
MSGIREPLHSKLVKTKELLGRCGTRIRGFLQGGSVTGICRLSTTVDAMLAVTL